MPAGVFIPGGEGWYCDGAIGACFFPLVLTAEGFRRPIIKAGPARQPVGNGLRAPVYG